MNTKLFGFTSDIRHDQFPGQLNLFHLQTEDEPEPVPLEEEYIEVKAHKKACKSKAAYDEVFADLPTENVYVDTLTEEQKTCDVCGTMMVPIGHEFIRTELRYTEPKLERIDYYATTYECTQCKGTEDTQFIKDEGTLALIPGSYVSSGLAAHDMVRYWEEKTVKKKTVGKEFRWLTNIRLTKRNVEKVAETGRKRWKIENEGFNCQKNWQGDITHAFLSDLKFNLAR